jgi:hypothetical protein
MSVVDFDKANFYFSYITKILSKFPERMQLIPKNVNYIPFTGKYYHSYLEKLSSVLYYNFNINNLFVPKYLDRLYKEK